MSGSVTTPLVVGIVGGIGSGKSSIVRLVKSPRLHIVDADRIGHRLLQDPGIRDALQRELGAHILVDGEVDRRRLAQLVFGNVPEARERLARLNAILHPAIRERIHAEIQSVPAAIDVIVLDAALLLEAGWESECDAIVFLDTPLKLRRRRVLETRAWSAAELADREATQWPLSQKRAASDCVIDNAGLPATAAEQLAQFLQQLVERRADH